MSETCPCACHGRWQQPCDVAGGCGHLHRAKQVVLYGARCLLCRETSRSGGTVCWAHHDELRDMLDPDNPGDRDLGLPASIPVLLGRLDPARRTGDYGERRAPGFASTPPCDLLPIVMLDPRSRCGPAVDVWYDPDPTTGADDLSRPHFEDDAPPRSVSSWLSGFVAMVAERLELPGPRLRSGGWLTPGAGAQCAWLLERLSWLTRQDDSHLLIRDVRGIHRDLRRATGDRDPEPLFACTNPVRDRASGEVAECGRPVYPPPGAPPMADDEPVADIPLVQCSRCHAVYDGLAQLRLRVAAAKQAARVPA